MYQGSSKLILDGKGRMSVPARYRDALSVQCEGRLTLTKHPEGCLLMFPRPVWEGHREKIAAWPMQARTWQRIFLGSAVDLDLDGSGRMVVPPELREAAGLAKEQEIMLMGMGSHFEIWNVAALARQEAEAVAQGMPPAIADFSF